MRPSNLIAVSGFLLALICISLWLVDVSVSAMLSNGALTNGFFNSPPMMMYHIGLYSVIISVFLMFLIVVHTIVKDHKLQRK